MFYHKPAFVLKDYMILESIKKKKILGIFAHPDDDVFGPGGTLLKLANQGNLIYEIFLTSGDAGYSSKDKLNKKTIGKKREQESLLSGKILGVKKMWFLRYKDGLLSNNLYHKVAADLEKLIQKIKPDYLLTYEWRGVSGHIDHVFTSFVVSFLAKKMRLCVLYYGLIDSEKVFSDYFIFFPPGYKKRDFDLLVNIEEVYEMKKKAILCHKSQIKDVKQIIRSQENKEKIEAFFLVDFNQINN